jgi:hypothetical protein
VPSGGAEGHGAADDLYGGIAGGTAYKVEPGRGSIEVLYDAGGIAGLIAGVDQHSQNRHY